MADKDKTIEAAKKAAKEKVDFIRHLIIYGAVIVFLAIINNITYSGYQWWLWPALGWGIGVFFHFISAWGLKTGKLKSLEKRLAEKEMERMKEGK
jgi:hypothetical protein